VEKSWLNGEQEWHPFLCLEISQEVSTIAPFCGAAPFNVIVD